MLVAQVLDFTDPLPMGLEFNVIPLYENTSVAAKQVHVTRQGAFEMRLLRWHCGLKGQSHKMADLTHCQSL